MEFDKILTYTVAVVGVFQGITTIIVNLQKMKPNNKKRPNQPSTKRRKGRK